MNRAALLTIALVCATPAFAQPDEGLPLPTGLAKPTVQSGQDEGWGEWSEWSGPSGERGWERWEDDKTPVYVDSVTASGPASAREKRYAAALARLGALRSVEQVTTPVDAGPALSTITNRIDDSSETVHQVEPTLARGVRVKLDALTATRLRFPSAREALDWAGNTDIMSNDDGVLRVVEVRGDQVVLLEGDALKDADTLAAARESAWGTMTAPAETQFLGVTRGDDMAGAVFVPEGDYYEATQRAVEKSHEKRENLTAEHGMPAEFREDGSVRVAFANQGIATELFADDRGARHLIGKGTFEQNGDTVRDLGALLNQLVAGSKLPAGAGAQPDLLAGRGAVEGAAKAVERVLGGF